MNSRLLRIRAWEVIARSKNRVLNLLDAPLIVLLYHRVADLPRDPQMLAVSPENFREQLKFLKENLPIVKLDSSFDTMPRPAVAITFDDGYADNCQNALPILEELQLPATFFISPGYISGNVEFWWDEAERVILESPTLPSIVELPNDELACPFTVEEDRTTRYLKLLSYIRKLDAPLRAQLLGSIRASCGEAAAARESHRPLNYVELRILAESPLAIIGGHGVTHTPLSAISAERQREEILGSKKALEEMTGKEVRLFSYPLGTRVDYTKESVSFCREAGFTAAASNFPGQVHRWTDRYQLPRHLVRNWPLETFKKNLQSFWTL